MGTGGKISLDLQKYHALQDGVVNNMTEYPEGRFKGQGIVICGGGPRYFSCAWVCINMLRHWGCTLPIEVWYLGDVEMDDAMRGLLATIPGGKITTVDAYKIRETYPARRLSGWELNPYSIIHSKFEEVIFLDADNVALRDPRFFFKTTPYIATGAIFWPDYRRLEPSRPIWEICRVNYRDEPEFESGQIVVDKRRCWRSLQMAMHLNEHSDFYYKHIHGDKDTFHMAWHMLEQVYAMPSRGIEGLDRVMCQHDFEGNRVFQHRNMAKWPDAPTAKIRGFQEEARCYGYFHDLNKRWSGKVGLPSTVSSRGRTLQAQLIAQRHFTYLRVGYDERDLELLSGNQIGKGLAGLEQRWFVLDSAQQAPRLCIVGESNTTCQLQQDGDGVWRGKWSVHEGMPIELIPKGTASVTPAVVQAAVRSVAVVPPAASPATYEGKGCAGEYIYMRVGYDLRRMVLGESGAVTHGATGIEKVWWHVAATDGSKGLLCIGAKLGDPICSLSRSGDGVWRGDWTKHERMPIQLVPIPK